MKPHPVRLALAGSAVAAALLSSGCAHLIDGMNELAYQLDQENERMAAEQAAYHQQCLCHPSAPPVVWLPGLR